MPETEQKIVEAMAKVIYDKFDFDGPRGSKPDWVERGNSLKQGEARSFARAALAAALPLIIEDMMEPTPNMVAAAVKSIPPSRDNIERLGNIAAIYRNVFQAMLRAYVAGKEKANADD